MSAWERSFYHNLIYCFFFLNMGTLTASHTFFSAMSQIAKKNNKYEDAEIFVKTPTMYFNKELRVLIFVILAS